MFDMVKDRAGQKRRSELEIDKPTPRRGRHHPESCDYDDDYGIDILTLFSIAFFLVVVIMTTTAIVFVWYSPDMDKTWLVEEVANTFMAAT